MSGPLTTIARKLRKNSTDAERVVWHHLRQLPFNDYKFRRQAPLGSYIVDFVCHRAKLVIELDGGQHAEPSHKAQDASRDEWLQREGYHVLRFWNQEVLSNIDGVMETIANHLNTQPATSFSSPLMREGQGEGDATNSQETE